MRIEILTICDQLLASAVNGAYQGIIVAAFVAFILRFAGRTNAATRHAVWFCTLLVLVSLPLAHGLIGFASFSPKASKTGVASIPNPAVAAFHPVVPVSQNQVGLIGTDSTASVVTLGYQTLGPTAAMEWPTSSTLSLTPTVASVARSSLAGELSLRHGKPNGNELPEAASTDGELASNVTGETTGFRWLVERLVSPVSLNLALGSNFPKIAGLILLALWMTIAGLRVLALLLQLAGIQKLKHRSFPPGAELSELFQKLAARLDVHRKVELKVSPTHRSSILLGFLHPVILLPSADRLEPLEAELVLRHELAHVRRCDDWVNLVQHFLLAVFFFHPAVWWISRQLSLEREIACDDDVLQQSGRPQAYALLLASLAARMQRGLPLLAPGSSNNKTQLKERIDMILNKHRNASPRLAKKWLAFIASTVAVIAVAIICSAPRIVLAQIETAAAAANAPLADAPSIALASESASVAFVPDSSNSDSADTTPRATPPPAAVGSGPKFKSASSSAQNPPHAVNATPVAVIAPAAVPTVVAAPVPPTPFLAAVQPVPEPRAPRSPRPPRAQTAVPSLEERLERLEQMVESLMAQQNLKPGRSDFNLKDPSEKKRMIEEIAKIEALAKCQAELAQAQMINPKEFQKIVEQAEREAERAANQVRRATADMEKAVKANEKRHPDRKLKEGSQRQLEVLRQQMEILERQKEKLDHEIEHLEQDQEELGGRRDEAQADDDTQRHESEEESVTQPPAAR